MRRRKSKNRLYMRFRTPDGKQSPYCPALFDAKSRIRSFWCVVKGVAEYHPDGTYYRRIKRDGSWAWESLGNDPNNALDRLNVTPRESAKRQASEAPVTTAVNDGYRIDEEIAVYLSNVAKLAPKTYKAYKHSLELFRQVCKKIYIHQIAKQDLQKFDTDLVEQGDSDRTRHNRSDHPCRLWKRQKQGSHTYLRRGILPARSEARGLPTPCPQFNASLGVARELASHSSLPNKKPIPLQRSVIEVADAQLRRQFRVNGKRVWESASEDPVAAVNFRDSRLFQLKHPNSQEGHRLAEKHSPTPPYESTSAPEQLRIADEMKTYLSNCEKLSAKTHSAYKLSLTLFQQSCPKTHVDQVRKQDLQAFDTFLARRGDDDSTRSNRIGHIVTFLRNQEGRREGESITNVSITVRYVEAPPEAYTRQELEDRLCAAAARDQSRTVQCRLAVLQLLPHKLKTDVHIDQSAADGFQESDLPGGSSRTALLSARGAPS